MRLRKITFIRPALTVTPAVDAMEPLVFALLAARTPKDIETRLVDDRLEPVPYDEPTDLVALTVDTFTARRAYQIAAGFRARGVPVVMGGHQPTLLPEEALEHADTVVRGDGEGAWERLLEDAARGRPRRLYIGPRAGVLTGPQPDRRIFAGKRYAPISQVQYGRGCRYNCDFCSVRAFYGAHVAQRPVEDVLRDIGAQGRRLVNFVDDNLFISSDATRRLLDALEGAGVRWACQASIDLADDPGLVRRMARSGCIAVLVGFESLDPRNLRQMKKQWNLKGRAYGEAVRRLHDAGIMVYGTFVFGYDHDGPEAFDATLAFAQDSGMVLANFNPLAPTPGTRLIARLEKEGRLLYRRWWLDPRYRYGKAMFRPRRMSPAELEAGCYRTRMAFYSPGAIIRRTWRCAVANRSLYRAGVCALANWISRREIEHKQGARLGGPGGLSMLETPS